MISRWLILALFAISAVVFVGVARKKNMWAVIALYWAVLTTKNLLDAAGL